MINESAEPKTIITSYEYYKNHTNGRIINERDYRKIAVGFMEIFGDILINIGMVKPPHNIGMFRVMGVNLEFRKNDKGYYDMRIDWKKTKKLWEECPECKEKKQVVNYFNEQTDFKFYKIFWIHKFNIVPRANLYKFKPCKGIRKKLSENIIKNNNIYLDKV